MNFIHVNQVTKTYRGADGDVPAIQKVHFQIAAGDFLAIMGPSGSGKSTLLSILGAMNPPTEGKVIIDEIDIYALSKERQADFRHTYLGFVFQQQHLISYLTALENVMLPMAISQEKKTTRYNLAKSALERVGLANKFDRLPSQLSGGEQSRVAIARAIVNEPPIILADEPTGNLDSKTGREVMTLLQSLNKEGSSVIVVTHNENNAKFAQKTIFLKDGLIEKVKQSKQKNQSSAGSRKI